MRSPRERWETIEGVIGGMSGLQSIGDGGPEVWPTETAARGRCSCPQSPVPHALKAGEIFFSREPAHVEAVLGSCVAVALRDPRSGVGGMNHYLVPRWRGGPETAKYGDVANVWLLARFERLGIPVSRLCAKVFGGACVIRSFCDRPNRLCDENVATARTFLGGHRIPIDEEHVAGTSGLRVAWDTGDGRASVRRLRS